MKRNASRRAGVRGSCSRKGSSVSSWRFTDSEPTPWRPIAVMTAAQK